MSRVNEPASWLVLAYRVPAEAARLRMSVWRRLKAAGAVYLVNSVAALLRAGPLAAVVTSPAGPSPARKPHMADPCRHPLGARAGQLPWTARGCVSYAASTDCSRNNSQTKPDSA